MPFLLCTVISYNYHEAAGLFPRYIITTSIQKDHYIRFFIIDSTTRQTN